MKLRTFILLMLIFKGLDSFSQSDSTRSQQPPRFYFTGFDLWHGHSLNDSAYTDKSLESVHLYDKLQRDFIFIPRGGNMGSAHKNVFDVTDNPKLFNDGFNQFDHYLLNPLDVRTGIRENRFSNVEFHLGSKKEQHIFLKHQQRFRPWFIAGLDFGAMASPGDFSRQLNNIRNFDLYTAYESQSRIYRAFASYTSNRVFNEENGGISNDTVFETATSLDTKTLPVNLNNAEITMKTRDYFLKHQMNISALFSNRDSIYRRKNFCDDSFVLSHTFWIQRKSVLFTSENPDSGYFSNFYFDSTTTYDSSFYNDLYNNVTLEYKRSNDNLSWSLGAGAENQYTEYETYGIERSFDSYSAIGFMKMNTKNIDLDISLTKNVSGDFEEAYKAEGELSFNVSQVSGKLNVGFLSGKLAPSAKQLFYVSNHFIWMNRMELTDVQLLKVGYEWSRINLNFELKTATYKNYIYYGTDQYPETHPGSVTVTSGSLKHVLYFSRFGLINRLLMMQSNEENIIHVPDYALFSGLFFENDFFKNALKLRAGIDVRYHAAYYADEYMPATGVFYLQNEKKTGDYPVLDFYINMKIKTSRIFFKFEHFNAGFSDRTYYSLTHYPMPGRGIKFGINWEFVD